MLRKGGYAHEIISVDEAADILVSGAVLSRIVTEAKEVVGQILFNNALGTNDIQNPIPIDNKPVLCKDVRLITKKKWIGKEVDILKEFSKLKMLTFGGSRAT